MKNTKVVVAKKRVEDYTGEMLTALVARDAEGEIVADPLLEPMLQALKEIKEFSAKKEQVLQLYPAAGQAKDWLPCKRLLLLGLGNIDEPADRCDIYELFRTVGGIIAGQCKKNRIQTVGVALPGFVGLDEAIIAKHLTEGILLGAYQFLKYKKKEEDDYPGLEKIEFFIHADKSEVRSGIAQGTSSALAVRTARDMANEPGNYWTPSHFAKYAATIAGELHLKCTVLEKSHMKKLGMGGMLAVNSGSKEPPKFIILEYRPEEYQDTLLLVGKGLTFDSGGISLKPAPGMMDMKYDMCGGAAVLAAMEAIAREKTPVRVVAIVPSTDNMAGGGAVKPGDVITHYGGLTSEVENTDAEGRLILADALAYGIEKFQPDGVIDLATLTGAVIIALGHHYSGLMSNNDQLTERLIAAGQASGEPLWRLPLGEMYAKQLKSEVADMKNTGGKTAGSITAAEYLHKFVGKVPWAHLDIAGTAWDFTEKPYIPKGPSGVGVRTLIELLRGWESSPGKKE